MTERLGILGGSFDPVHNGHLALARAAVNGLLLQRVVFVPAARNPLKPQDHPCATNEQRLAMVEFAIAGEPAMSANTVEMNRGGVSYTVDTLRWFTKRHAGAALFLLMGADAAMTLGDWKDVGEFSRLCTVAVAGRLDTAGGQDLQESLDLLELKYTFIEMPPVAASSSDIRRRIAAGLPAGHLVPGPVAAYIEEHGLYCCY